MPSMKIMGHVLHILRILAGVGMLFLAYYFGAYLLDWKGSKGDAFTIGATTTLMGYQGTSRQQWTWA